MVSEHAAERLEERGVLEWQIIDGIRHANPLRERPRDRPNPSVEAELTLADGTAVKVVWSHVVIIDIAKLVTVHFFE